ncbi:Protein 21.1 [Giardia lamblia P15]|uniref:Protein 21.1 n=1 Tax=Giardia intestinalis (strain P15) TaxID=658858 RepID=E1F730_GIAIA|nr:Protein 21.1 [Giardia lamblia P15]
MAIACVNQMLSDIDVDTSALYSRIISVDGLPDTMKNSVLSAWTRYLFNKEDQSAINHALPFLLSLKTATMDENRYLIRLRYRFSRGVSLEAVVAHHVKLGTYVGEDIIVYLARVALTDMDIGMQHDLLYGLSQKAVLVDQNFDKFIYTVYAPASIVSESTPSTKDHNSIVNPVSKKELIEYSISSLGMLLFEICTLSSMGVAERTLDPTLSLEHIDRLCNCGYSRALATFIVTCLAFPHSIDLAEANSAPSFSSFGDAISAINAVTRTTTCGTTRSTDESLLNTVRRTIPTTLCSETGATQSDSGEQGREQERNVIQNLIASQNIKCLAEHVTTESGASILSSLLEDKLILAKRQYTPELATIVQACVTDRDLCIRVNARDPDLSPIKTYLISAAQRGDVKAILQNYAEIGFAYGKYTALMEAARRNNFRVIPFLLGELGCVNATGQTALMLAAHFNNVEAVKLLLMEVGITDKWGTTALMMACMRGHDTVVELLLPESRKQDEWGNTAMMYAAQNGHLGCVKLLLSRETKMVTKISSTALSQAMMCGHKDCAIVLQEEEQVSNITPLMRSVFFDSCGEALTQSINECADTFSYANKAGFTAIMFAAAGHNWDAVNLLLPYETQHLPNLADLHIKNVDEAARDFFSEAVQKRYIHLVFVFATYVHYLLKHGKIGAFKQKYDSDILHTWSGIPALHLTGLMECAKRGDVIGVRASREDYCKVFDGYTALMLGIINRMAICSRLLLVEMGIQGAEGMTALMHAVDSGQVDLVSLLLAEAPIKNAAGDTALDIAKRRAKGHPPDSPYNQCVSMLLNFQC